MVQGDRGLKIDVGCGYRGDLHFPNKEVDIHLEPFLKLSKKAYIDSLNNPIIASAQNLPFRRGVFKELYCRAVMEHLPKPYKALKDCRRVLKKNGKGEFVIPIITNHYKHFFYLCIIAFPFGFIEVKGLMLRLRKHYRDEGLLHLSDVKPKHIYQFFRRHEIITLRYRHKWFYGWWGKIIKKILRLKREPIRDIQGNYTVRVWK